MVVKRASKTTLQRLTKMAKRDNYSMNQYTLLLDLVNNAENVLDCGNDGFVLEWGSYQNGHYQIDHEGSHKITYIVAEVEKRYFYGLLSKYGCELVSTAFTHGNRQLLINDINRLVRLMYEDFTTIRILV